ncbi:MAG: tRNA pseudouridine(38-40) synthase TruA [Ardenticatenaceae bacterium]|nr:tRNA pseudouridine(38-40) synthase TruA [Ardenticatenaceae bacterium]MCB9442717.1 tRNA pseudouridine(38-40) synthase TruA [Ardenticatenaceae bacterium]
MLRYKALIEYDGTAYYGFQRQIKEQHTIQGELEKAIARLTQQPINVIGAGRTDSGVHALGQVISFDLDWRHDIEALQRAINANLPADIVILQLNQVSPTFHPRFDARRRSYAYHIFNAAVRSPVRRFQSWHVRHPLDVGKMNQAASVLLGRHDFGTFGQPPVGENRVRELFRAEWIREREFLVFHIEANAFLYRMVRSLVGSMKLVGEGSWTVEDFVAAFRSCDRSRSGTAAPPQGLYLVSVTYGNP